LPRLTPADEKIVTAVKGRAACVVTSVSCPEIRPPNVNEKSIPLVVAVPLTTIGVPAVGRHDVCGQSSPFHCLLKNP
jgi:hypothetical protein